MTRVRRINVSQIEGDGANNTSTDEIRPYGELALYVGDNGKLELLLSDGVRTHVKNKVLNKGTFYGGDADSSDGNGFDTIKLVPDETLRRGGSEQYLVIEPTTGEPGHIHIRAGGTIDQSGADLFLGGEQQNVRVSDANDRVSITTDLQYTWTFDGNGDLTFPGGSSKIGESEPGLVVFSDNGFAVVTNADADPSPFWIFDSQGNLTIPGNIQGESAINIDINLTDSTLRRWQFGEDGSFSLPGNLTISPIGNYAPVNGTIMLQAPTEQLAFLTSDAGGGVQLGWGESAFEMGNVAIATFNEADSGEVKITTGGLGIGLTAYNWTFGNDGNLTLPEGGDILDSLGNSVLGGGGGGGGIQTPDVIAVRSWANLIPLDGLPITLTTKGIQYNVNQLITSDPAFGTGSSRIVSVIKEAFMLTADNVLGVTTLYMDGNIGADSNGVKEVIDLTTGTPYNGYYAIVASTHSGFDPSINRIIIADVQPAGSFATNDTDLEDLTVDVTNATDITVLVVYGNSISSPVITSDLTAIFQNFVDNFSALSVTARKDLFSGTGGFETNLLSGVTPGAIQLASDDISLFGREFYVKNLSGSIAGTGASAYVMVGPSNDYWDTVITENGSNFAAGETITIPGTSLGGASPDNDVVITVDAVDGSNAIQIYTITSTTSAAAGLLPTINIIDGDDDQYDEGNYISTNLGGRSTFTGTVTVPYPTFITSYATIEILSGDTPAVGEMGDLTELPIGGYVAGSSHIYVVDIVPGTAQPSYSFFVAGDDSTAREIVSGDVLQIVGAGGATVTTDVDGRLVITAGGGGGSDTITSLELTQTAYNDDFWIGDWVYFTKPNNTVAADVIDTDMTITRNANGGIYNSALESAEVNWDETNESSWWPDDASTLTPPIGTEWNNDGWYDLSDVTERTYTSWMSVHGSWPGHMHQTEYVMHDMINDKYYAVQFLSWQVGNQGGGFSWRRRQINTSIYFNKPSSNTSLAAEGLVDAIAPGLTLTRGNNPDYWLYNSAASELFDQNISPQGTLWNAQGWDDLSNYTSRQYLNFRSVSKNLMDEFALIVGMELIMHDTINDEYYAFMFTSWDNTNNYTYPGFSYVRRKLNATNTKQGLTFVDGSIQQKAITEKRLGIIPPWKHRSESSGNTLVLNQTHAGKHMVIRQPNIQVTIVDSVISPIAPGSVFTIINLAGAGNTIDIVKNDDYEEHEVGAHSITSTIYGAGTDAASVNWRCTDNGGGSIVTLIKLEQGIDPVPETQGTPTGLPYALWMISGQNLETF